MRHTDLLIWTFTLHRKGAQKSNIEAMETETQNENSEGGKIVLLKFELWVKPYGQIYLDLNMFLLI